MNSSETFGKTLRRLRRRRGISLESFAREVGVSRPTIWAWETDRSVPTAKNRAALARALNRAEDALIVDAEVVEEAAADVTLEELVADAKHRIALKAGTTSDLVEIVIKF